MKVRVKICGITSADDARAAVDAGADAIGLNFLSSSPRYIGSALESVLEAIAPFVQVAGVFVDASLHDLEPYLPFIDVLQLHGRESPDFWYRRPVLKAVRLRSEEDLQWVSTWSRHARGFLLDGAGRPGTFGGATFDWSLVERARTLTDRPIVIAGGLTPDNVAQAVRATRPFAVDVASGVEKSPGRKDPALMRAFVRAVEEASRS